MPHLSRRQSIVALLTGGALVGLAGTGLLLTHEKDVIAAILGRVIGPYRMADSQFDQFVADLATPVGRTNRIKFALYRAFSATDPDTLLRFAPDTVQDGYTTYERRVVTNFLTRTNFMTIGGPSKEVSFVGAAVCSSPFAKFELT